MKKGSKAEARRRKRVSCLAQSQTTQRIDRIDRINPRHHLGTSFQTLRLVCEGRGRTLVVQ
ncbi:hypothetical protein I7I50_07704 [Histoplasma capsulatum G186AR]|uniref:Uncharacterized protein n=1 Tax=Ajellomyces capsulatus TaxID=5037 RepID=A0A8H7YXJ1_AJECA|nr:hypothetical protein I7I52_09224 [Histoplasma capsulatum]QSS68334.1 hypothetical protein I7I50_07704 [Histoplasma capsulatum G186AR]